jgi:cytochrome P450
LFVWLAASGRDPEVFSDPDRFDIRRHSARHNLAFGKGINFCIGSALAKLEARLALEALSTRFPASGSRRGRSRRFIQTSTSADPQTLWAPLAELDRRVRRCAG